MKVSEALDSRFTCRAFLDKPVPEATVRAILTKAGRTPSGGNLQPWHVWALAGDELAGLKVKVKAKLDQGEFSDGPMEYMIYPPNLKDPYEARRNRVGEMMYQAIGVNQDDGQGRFAQIRRNFEFFDAPVGLFLALDRGSHQGQWADLGMFLQSVMLLAREHGLHTAPLESWAMFHQTVREHTGMSEDMMLYCGIGIGHPDMSHPVNQWRAERASLAEFAEFRGF